MYDIIILEREQQTKFATTQVRIHRKLSYEVCHVIYRWNSIFAATYATAKILGFLRTEKFPIILLC